MEIGLIYAIAGAAVAFFLAGVGSAIGLQITGSTASGALSENPELFGKIFLLAVLPSTQGFYGFIIAIIIILKLGLFGATPAIPTTEKGLQILCASLPVGITGLISAIHQGIVCGAGIQMAAKRPESSMRPVIYGVMVETYAVLGLVVSFLLIMFGIRL